MNSVPPFIRFLIFVVMEVPALVLWLVGLHQAFVRTWILGEHVTAPEYLRWSLDWTMTGWSLAAMTVGYVMFEFGGMLRGNRRLGNICSSQRIST